jgi:hypothetical protein
VEEFGPGDREEWCVTGGCDATWSNGIVLVAAGRGGGSEPDRRLAEWAADRGYAGTIEELTQ